MCLHHTLINYRSTTFVPHVISHITLCAGQSPVHFRYIGFGGQHFIQRKFQLAVKQWICQQEFPCRLWLRDLIDSQTRFWFRGARNYKLAIWLCCM